MKDTAYLSLTLLLPLPLCVFFALLVASISFFNCKGHIRRCCKNKNQNLQTSHRVVCKYFARFNYNDSLNILHNLQMVNEPKIDAKKSVVTTEPAL